MSGDLEQDAAKVVLSEEALAKLVAEANPEPDLNVAYRITMWRIELQWHLAARDTTHKVTTPFRCRPR
eukprot:SAG22_NODE_2328_length_2709_cov_9.759004_3_plen_68_part_00